jgi:ABC-2 type transport system permease protein
LRNGLFQDIQTTLLVTQKDLLDFWKAKMLVAFFMIMPILFMSMFGFMFPQTGASNPFSGKVSTPYKNAPIGIVLEDRGPFALQVADQFREMSSSTGLFKVQDFASFESAREQIVSGNLKGVVVIPVGFTEAFNSQRQATVIITVDDTNPQIASIIYSEAASIFKAISDGLSVSLIAKMDNGVDPSFVSKPISVENRDLIAGTANTFQFLAPGFIALTAVMGVLSGLGAAISREKEQGTMDGLMVAPVSRYSIVVGKILAQTVRGLIQGFMILIISMFLFGVRVYGNPLLMMLVMLLGVASFSGIGIVVTSMAAEQETAQMMMMMLQFPMMFLCGIVFPIEQLPIWLQAVGKLLPLYYAADALRKIMVLNASFSQVFLDIGVLGIYSVVTMGMAMPIFRKVMRR